MKAKEHLEMTEGHISTGENQETLRSEQTEQLLRRQQMLQDEAQPVLNEQHLTPKTRLAITRIKDAWYQLPAYRQEVYSTDIYDAVLQHGVRTLTEFDDYLAQRGKPTRAKS